MSHVTIYTLRKMRDAGFSYPEYEHMLNYGMLYHYRDDEYSIGGFSRSDFSDRDRDAAQQGEWLPDAAQLLSWLKNTDFKVDISMEDDGRFSIQATDKINGASYNGGGYTLANALAKVIIKICKSNRRRYDPEPSLILDIVE